MRGKEDVVKGRAWLLGNNIDTDQIISGRYLRMLDYSEMAKHALEIPRPEFASEIRHGDIIVAGRNFGGGSSREEAPRVLQELGVGCIIAESFARIFYRNAFNIGLPAMILRNATSVIQDGENIEVKLSSGQITLIDRGLVLEGERIPMFMMQLLSVGGAINWYRKNFGDN